MKKYAYLAKLEDLLAGLPAQEREDALAYYEEYIDAAGKEKEEQTIAALGSPEEVAQKILEGEGLAADTDDPVGGVPDAPKDEQPAAPQPEPAPAAPAAPEPPAAFAANEPAPASYTPGAQSGTKGFHPFQNPPKPFSRRGWIIFVAVLAIALIVQLAVFIHFVGRSAARRTSETVSAPDFPRTDNTAMAVPGIDHGYNEASTEHYATTDDAVTYVPSSSADGTISLYDDKAQEVELHITSANLYISHDAASEQVHLEISGLDADKFETSYQTDDGRRKLVVRDGRKVGADTPAEKTTVTLTLPYDFRDVEAKLVTGNINLVDLLNIRDLELETGTGDIEAGALTVDKLDLKTNTGNITVGPITPGAGEHEVDLKTGTGNIEAALDAAQTEYEYELKAQRGSVLLNSAAMGGSAQSRSGRYELEASAYTGDVSVTFAG